MNNLYEVYNMLDVIEYELFQKEVEQFLKTNNYIFTTYPNMSEFMKIGKYEDTIPLLEVISVDKTRAIKVYTENISRLTKTREVDTSYKCGLDFYFSVKKDEQGNFFYGYSGAALIQLTLEELFKWIDGAGIKNKC